MNKPNTDTVFWCISEVGKKFPDLNPSSLLHPAEQARFLEMKIPKRRDEWLHGRLAAKQLLTSPRLPLSGTPYNQILIDNYPEGAPFISAPALSGSLSITHRDAIACIGYAQTPDSQIGIDFEKIEPRAWSFVEDFFTADETAHAHNLPEFQTDLWVTLVWSAKEAILKVWQKGLRLDTRSVEILPVSPKQLAAPTQGWQYLTWENHLADYPDCWLCWQRHEDYLITLAGENKTGDPKAESPVIQQIKI